MFIQVMFASQSNLPNTHKTGKEKYLATRLLHWFGGQVFVRCRVRCRGPGKWQSYYRGHGLFAADLMRPRLS